jgi:hypothetical protein
MMRVVSADIVVLVDISASMGPSMDVLRNAWVSFVRELLGPAEPAARHMDLRFKVVGYAMSEDGTQPVIFDNPFVHADVSAFEAQFANLKSMPTNHSPRPLLDALWRTVSIGSMSQESEVMDPAKWRDCMRVRRIVAIFTDSSNRDQMQITEAATGTVDDVGTLLMRKHIKLYIFATEHESLAQLAVYAEEVECFGDLADMLKESRWQKRIMSLLTRQCVRTPLEVEL